MLAQPAEFPHAGSRAFLGESADPVTILRRNTDGTALIRRDPRPFERRNRDASGNREVALTDLFATAEEAARAWLPTPRRRTART